MRFFKAFNILHRRAKSASFIPSNAPFDLHPPDVRASSFSDPSSQKGRAPSVFDLVIPGNFNHVPGTSGPWRLRRSARTSTTSIEPEIENEQLRLRDAINFWIHEHSILQDLLKNSEEKLLLERRKVVALEHRIGADRRKTLELQTRYENLLGKLHPADNQAPSKSSLSKPQPLHSFESSVPRQPSHEQLVKLRTPDAYSAALRMTLMTRRQLRDQKKTTKFWKCQAISEGKQSTMTPSASTLSSLHEVLPVERQAALEALVSRLGLTSKLGKIHANDSLSYPSMTTINVRSLSNEDSQSPMCTSPSRTSTISSLSPLASESIKTEISLIFGSKNKPRQASSPTRAPGVASTHGKKAYRASISSQIDIESFNDLNLVFEVCNGSRFTHRTDYSRNASLQRVFGSDINRGPDASIEYTPGDMQHSNAIPPRSLELPWSNLLLPASLSQAPISSIPSRTSQTFGNDTDELNSDSAISNSLAHRGSKDHHTSRSSFQDYMVKSTVTNRHKSPSPRKPAKEKENVGFPMSLHIFRRKQSRLPVPAFMKGDVS